MRRVMAVLVVWVGLFGVISPTIACPLPALPDCCPSGSGSPCQGHESGTSGACCAVVPASAAASTADTHRVRLESHGSPGSPDPVIVGPWVTASQVSPSLFPHVAWRTSCHYSNASLTYLRTARLRL